MRNVTSAGSLTMSASSWGSVPAPEVSGRVGAATANPAAAHAPQQLVVGGRGDAVAVQEHQPRQVMGRRPRRRPWPGRYTVVGRWRTGATVAPWLTVGRVVSVRSTWTVVVAAAGAGAGRVVVGAGPVVVGLWVVVDRAAVLGDDVAAREVAVRPVGAVADEPLLHAAGASATTASDGQAPAPRWAPERVRTTGAWCVIRRNSAKPSGP